MTRIAIENLLREWKIESPKHVGRSAHRIINKVVEGEFIYILKQHTAINGHPIYLDTFFVTTTIGKEQSDENPNADLHRLKATLKDFDEAFEILFQRGLDVSIKEIDDASPLH